MAHATRGQGEDEDERLPTHPLGVRPAGNLLLNDDNGPEQCSRAAHFCRRKKALGCFSNLADDIILRLLSHLDAGSLARVSECSSMLYVFANERELWRALTISHCHQAQQALSHLRFNDSWKRTYVSCTSNGLRPTVDAPSSTLLHHQLRTDPSRTVYSDVLYHAWRCAAGRIRREWLTRDNLAREDAQLFSPEEFNASYARTNTPVVLRGACKHWQACAKWSDADTLSHLCGNHATFNAGGLHFTMRDYIQYARSVSANVGADDQPLYLFDKNFTQSAPKLASDYEVPQYFSDDLFALLDGTQHRPDFRWLIVGPPRSGSSFHKDPNATSAWNAVVSGAKKWILFPPQVTSPPGVTPSDDGCEVRTPLSLQEWFMNYYEQARAHPMVLEGICEAGDVLFVPRGWWHAAMNLDRNSRDGCEVELTVAITQNFVSREALPHVLHFLRTPRGATHAAHISGVASHLRASLLSVFEEHLEQNEPGALAHARNVLRMNDTQRLQTTSIWKRLSSNAAPNKRDDDTDHAKTGSGIQGQTDNEGANKRRKTEHLFSFEL